MRKTLLIGLAVLGVGTAAIAACVGDSSNVGVTSEDGGDDGGLDGAAPTDGATEAALDGGILGFVDATVYAECDQFRRCCAAIKSPLSATSFDICVNTGDRTASAVIAAGRAANIRMNQPLASACLTDLVARGCVLDDTAARQLSTECYAGIDGLLGIGAICMYSVECSQPGYCMYAKGSDPLGVCHAPEPVGAPCGTVRSDVYQLIEQKYSCGGRNGAAATCNSLQNGGDNKCQNTLPIGASCNSCRDCCLSTCVGDEAGACATRTIDQNRCAGF